MIHDWDTVPFGWYWTGYHFTPSGLVSFTIHDNVLGGTTKATARATSGGTITIPLGSYPGAPCDSSATATDLTTGRTTGACVAQRVTYFDCPWVLL